MAVSAAATSGAQEPPEPLPPAPTGEAPEPRPGLWRLGPVYVTPTFHVGNVGVDTNVLFRAADRQRDFSLSGGPGLELVLPVTRALSLSTSGRLDYLYFARASDQRRLTGDARAGIRWTGASFLAGGEYSHAKTFGRPSPEVDDRADQTRRRTRAELGFGGGARRFGISAAFTASRYELDAGQVYLGSDLAAALSRDEDQAQLVLRYGLTPKTSLVLAGDQEWDRFQRSPARDADSNRALIGFEVDSETRLAGRAVGGIRSFRLRGSTASRLFACANVDLGYSVSPRTRFELRYRRDLEYSAFASSGETPTLATQSYGLGLRKLLVARLDLRLAGALKRLASDGDVSLLLPDQGLVVAPRRDDLWLASADLGYTFGSRLRVGLAATYANRESTIDYFGVRGLVMGATVVYSGTPTLTLHP